MPLTCDYNDDCDWYFDLPTDFEPLATKRARRCASCRARIGVGDTALAFQRWRPPQAFVEEKIYGDGGEVPLATKYLCEPCGGLFFALTEDRGYCVSPNEDMRELAREAGAIDRERAARTAKDGRPG